MLPRSTDPHEQMRQRLDERSRKIAADLRQEERMQRSSRFEEIARQFETMDMDEAIRAITASMEAIPSSIPAVFGREFPDGYYLVRHAPSGCSKDIVGVVVLVRNARLIDGNDVARLVSEGFALERVHVLTDMEYKQITSDDGHLPFYEALPDLAENADLRHCAHCGGSGVLGKVFAGSRTARKGFKWYLECTRCGVRNEDFTSKSMAVDWWNHRDTRVVNPPLVIRGTSAKVEIKRGDTDEFKITRR